MCNSNVGAFNHNIITMTYKITVDFCFPNKQIILTKNTFLEKSSQFILKY